MPGDCREAGRAAPVQLPVQLATLRRSPSRVQQPWASSQRSRAWCSPQRPRCASLPRLRVALPAAARTRRAPHAGQRHCNMPAGGACVPEPGGSAWRQSHGVLAAKPRGGMPRARWPLEHVACLVGVGHPQRSVRARAPGVVAARLRSARALARQTLAPARCSLLTPTAPAGARADAAAASRAACRFRARASAGAQRFGGAAVAAFYGGE